MNLKKINKFKKTNLQEIISTETPKTQENITKLFKFLVNHKTKSMSIGLIEKKFSISRATALRIVDKLKSYGFLQITQTKANGVFESYWIISPIPVEEFITNAKGNNYKNKNGIHNTANKLKDKVVIEKEEITPQIEETTIDDKDILLNYVVNKYIMRKDEINNVTKAEINKHYYYLKNHQSQIKGYKSQLKSKKSECIDNINNVYNRICSELLCEINKTEGLLELFQQNKSDFNYLINYKIEDKIKEITNIIFVYMEKFLSLSINKFELECDMKNNRKLTLESIEFDGEPND